MISRVEMLTTISNCDIVVITNNKGGKKWAKKDIWK